VEVGRLIDITEAGQKIIQETRSYDADNNSTFSLRSKEEADDYRYFPDPDLTPFHITDDYLVSIKKALPELPESLEQKYQQLFHLPAYDAHIICSDKSSVDYFESITKHTSNYKAG
jgi:aspartyl-tRNA(Asn)/glutamyl-tRNA(Gln) amidotransferase subunit B